MSGFRYRSIPETDRKALRIGVLTVSAYIASYVMRNVLTVVSPFMLSDGYIKEYLAALSSVYMLSYAVGQFFGGFIGDMVRPKGMVITGFFSAALGAFVFTLLPQGIGQKLCFVFIGAGLSLLRGPLMKVITENTALDSSRLICVFFSATTFVGPLIVSLASLLLAWRGVFVFAALYVSATAVITLAGLSVLEKNYGVSVSLCRSTDLADVLSVFRIEGLGYCLVFACLGEMSVSSVSYWLPTLFSEYVGCGETLSGIIFSVLTLLRAVMELATLFIYRLIGEKDEVLIRGASVFSALGLVFALLAPVGVCTVIGLLAALLGFTCSAAMLWSIYIPTMGATGRMSAINGVVDCSGYAAAGLATSLFALVLKNTGWEGLIASWLFIPAAAFIANIIFV